MGETVLEWDDEDLEHYRVRRMAMDSMLCRFKAIYPAEHIDSVRYLLEDKEQQMRGIVKHLMNSKPLMRKLPTKYLQSCRKAYRNSPRNRNEKDSWESSAKRRK